MWLSFIWYFLLSLLLDLKINNNYTFDDLYYLRKI